jgi:hypothetical protein
VSAVDTLLFPKRFAAARWRFRHWSPAETVAFQREAASRIVRHVVRRSPFFASLYRGADLDDVWRLLLMLGGLLRIRLFPVWEQALASRRYLTAVALGFIAARSYPLIPYLGFGAFGSLLGLQLAGGAGRKAINATLFGAGGVWLASGVAGYILSPPVVGEVDLPWFFKVHIELGLFLLVVGIALNLTRFSWREAGGEPRMERSPLRRFSTISLSVFLLQMPVTEMLALVLRKLFPGWDGNMFLFGGANVVLWIAFVMIFQRRDTIWPAERLRRAFFTLVRRETTIGG